MRYNPFWFDDTGKPTENLEEVIDRLKKKLRSKLSEPFFPFDPESCSYHVVGSVSNGSWRSESDLVRIQEIKNSVKQGNELEEKELSYLSIFYSQREIERYFFDKSDKDFLNPGRMHVSDLDLKVKGINIEGSRLKKIYELLCLINSPSS